MQVTIDRTTMCTNAQTKSSCGPDNKCILVIDDNVDAGETMAMLLRLHGYKVVTADNGITGVQASLELLPQIIFLDITMPGMSGYETIAALRDTKGGQHSYIVALTGLNDEANRRAIREAGFNQHLVKPASMDAITAVLKRCA